jgi:hypothetical protein
MKFLADIQYPDGSEGTGKFIRDDDGSGRMRWQAEGGVLQWRVVQIADWNMDTTQEINVTIQDLDMDDIRHISGIVRDDSGLPYSYPIPSAYDSGNDMHIRSLTQSGDDVVVALRRQAGGLHDSSDFDQTGGYIRGWLTIGHV